MRAARHHAAPASVHGAVVRRGAFAYLLVAVCIIAAVAAAVLELPHFAPGSAGATTIVATPAAGNLTNPPRTIAQLSNSTNMLYDVPNTFLFTLATQECGPVSTAPANYICTFSYSMPFMKPYLNASLNNSFSIALPPGYQNVSMPFQVSGSVIVLNKAEINQSQILRSIAYPKLETLYSYENGSVAPSPQPGGSQYSVSRLDLGGVTVYQVILSPLWRNATFYQVSFLYGNVLVYVSEIGSMHAYSQNYSRALAAHIVSGLAAYAPQPS